MKVHVLFVLLLLPVCPAVAGPCQEIGIFRKFLAGRLAALASGGGPDERGFVGSNWPRGWIEAAMSAAMVWQKTPIEETGGVEVVGNTPTGVGKEAYLGKAKGVDYVSMVYAFNYYGLMHDDPKSFKLANRIFAWSRGSSKT